MKVLAVVFALFILLFFPLSAYGFDNSTEEDIADKAGVNSLPKANT